MRSRIITTTRNVSVAKHVGDCYNLKPLSDESAEMLFYGRIFGSKEKCPEQFFEVSKRILKKCGGVPLAIITTSSLLANKSENIKVWNDVCDSIGSGLGGNDSMDQMRKILLLSYYDLPSHLKTCLVYLSIFPEDYEIEKDQLIWRWAAEGFIQRDKKPGNQSFLEIGESCFYELVNRSLIQPAGMKKDGEPRACRVHDAVLDLIISLSAEECFITTVLGSDGVIESKVRWLSVHDQITWPTMKMPKLRSLTIFRLEDIVTDLRPSFSSYRLLRVLDLRGFYLRELASLGFLGSLSHLRYLGLSSFEHTTNDEDYLPAEIGNLHFLQTLDVYETNVYKLPSSITALEQLVFLRGRGGFDTTVLPDGLKKLTSLEVLESVGVEYESIAAELRHLTQLRVLKVYVYVSGRYRDDMSTTCGKALMESLGKLTKLETLYMDLCDEVDLNCSVQEPLGNLRWLCLETIDLVPTWIRPVSLPGLSYLHLVVEREQMEDIQVLGTLPYLTYLNFRVRRHPEPRRCVVGPNAFPRLVKCEFDIAGGGVVPRTFQGGAMPRLQEFTFRIKNKQPVDDLVLSHLPSLRTVTVCGSRFYIDDDSRAKKLREKLEHEAAVHPNHPSIRFHP
jgi:disease resistance protein RPM1